MQDIFICILLKQEREEHHQQHAYVDHAAAKWYWFAHRWTEEHDGKPEGMDEAS